MTVNEKIRIIANEFLDVFDAHDLKGRKKNLVRAVDAFVVVIKKEYPMLSLTDVSNLVNKEFKKNNKNFQHCDIIFALKRHDSRMDVEPYGDVFYRDCYEEIVAKLVNKQIIKQHGKEKETIQD